MNTQQMAAKCRQIETERGVFAALKFAEVHPRLRNTIVRLRKQADMIEAAQAKARAAAFKKAANGLPEAEMERRLSALRAAKAAGLLAA